MQLHFTRFYFFSFSIHSPFFKNPFQLSPQHIFLQKINMKPNERHFLSRHTTVGGISRVLQYLTTHLPKTFQHPSKTMGDCEMLSFLRGSLQIYLEFWNSSDPFEEYFPDFTKPSNSLQHEYENIISEICSLLTHIRSCQFLPNINTVEAMDKLHKLNIDFISILDQYFHTNIWEDIQ